MRLTQIKTEALFPKWHQLKISKSSALEELGGKGLSVEEISLIWENYSRYRLSKRITLGWTLMFVGGAVGLLSCVITMLDPLPDFRGLFMYGITSVAITMSLYGCYLVMEKPDDERG